MQLFFQRPKLLKIYWFCSCTFTLVRIFCVALICLTKIPFTLNYSRDYRTALWWYSERFVVITRQLLAAKCSLSRQLFGHIFTLLENLRFPYCCTPCKQTFVRLVCSSLGPCIKNLLFNFR
jgi:hypothetical protein